MFEVTSLGKKENGQLSDQELRIYVDTIFEERFLLMCSKFTNTVFVLSLYVTHSSYYQLLEQREENVKQTEALVSSERERVEALENALILKEEALPQQQKDLVFSSSWITTHLTIHA